MPPKGWKKNADPSEQPFRDTEPVSIDDILFPRTTISKLAKSITSDEDNQNNMTLAKDSLLALQRSATVFVSYMLFHAKQVSKATGRKTVTAQDIMAALERAEFAGFLPEVKQRLGEFESLAKAKKQKKLEEKSSSKEEETMTKKSRVETPDGKIESRKVVTSGTDDDDDEDEEDAEIEETEDRDDSSDEIEDGSDDEEKAETNPISELSKDEQELRGEEVDDEKRAEEEDDDEEEEEED